MGILRVESFDHWATADAPKKDWQIVGLYTSISAGNGRNGTACLRSYVTGSNLNQAKLAIANTGRYGVVGFAYRPATLPDSGAHQILGTVDATTNVDHVELRLHSTGAVSVTENSGLIIPASPGGVITAATWQYCELAWYIHQTNGYVEFRVNGVTKLYGNNVDTYWGGSGIWTGLRFMGAFGGNFTSDFDDVYVADDNVFRGDHRIMCVIASPGNGTYTDWTPSSGTNHGALVDDPTPDIADFNSAGIIGLRDTYNFAALGVPGIVAGVQTNAYMKADVAGTRHIVPTTRAPGGPAYDANGHILGPDWQYYTEFLSTNPVTIAPWTVAEIDDTEFGVKVEG